MPQLPRWLVIFGIACIVLGLVAGGIGGVRAFEEEPSGDTEPQESFRIAAPAVPRSDVRLEETSACRWATPPANTRRFSGPSCRLVVDAELLPRDLRLKVISASGLFRTMTVGQEIRGKYRTSQEDVPTPTMEVPIRVTQSSVTVTISCTTSCTFEVIE
jgi:hypothetical protein